MKKQFTVGEAAKAAQTTSETLRHYHRIGLITPSRTDAHTGYRYYTEQDLVRIHTVRALQQMDLPLEKIKDALELEDLHQTLAFFTQAEQRADEKIALLQDSKAKIQRAKSDYQKKLRLPTGGKLVRAMPERVILLSATLVTPTLDTLFQYWNHFYDALEPSQRDQFSFEDMAGIYTENGISRLFAVCLRYEKNHPGLKILPAGSYLCADCTEENREDTLRELLQLARDSYRIQPSFILHEIIVSGILQWRFQAQVYLGRA